MRRLNLFAAASFLAIALPAPGLAQLQPTDRVRILTVDGLTLTGAVTEMSPDSLMLSSAGHANWVRQSEIAYLERSAGQYRMFARNFVVTAGSVAAVGGALAAITWTECVSNEFLGCLMTPGSRGEAFVMGAAAGALLGTPIGVILGLAIKYDRWEPAQTPAGRRTRVSVMPVFDRGVGASASISF